MIWCDGSAEQLKIDKDDDFVAKDKQGTNLLNPDGDTEWVNPEKG